MTDSNGNDRVRIRQLTTPASVGPALRRELTECWVAVTNAGGAVGFPFPPVGETDVAPAMDRIMAGLAPEHSRLLVAMSGNSVAGWARLSRDPHRLIAHWGTVTRLQTHPAFQGRGVGSALLRSLRSAAREELGLEQLRLAVRGGAGLEGFYARLGWREAGRWPDALRLAADDYRDEVLMVLTPL